MELREIVNEIFLKKFAAVPEKQRARALANILNVGEMDIRRAAGIAPGSRRNQEKTFQLTLKILPLCKELGINPAGNMTDSARDLPPDAAEVINSEIQNDLSARSDEKMQTGKIKKAGTRAVSARGIHRHQRKHS